MSKLNRIALIGSHGVGKGWILENYNQQQIQLPPIRSFVTGYWKSFDKAVIRSLSLIDRIYSERSLMGAGENQFRENSQGFFERSPLDLLAYTKFLIQEISNENNVENVHKLEPIKRQICLDCYEYIREASFLLLDKYIDVLVYVPVDEKILEMRGDHTDHKEIPDNCKIVDGFMKESLREYYGTFGENTNKNTKLIVLNGKLENRLEVLEKSFEEIKNSQFVLNGHSFFENSK